MIQLKYISDWGATLPLVGNPMFVLTNVDGMTSATASISSNTIYGVDGDSVSNVQAQPRGIVLDLTMKQGVNVEDAKRQILSVIKIKSTGTLELTQNGRTTQISGVVESIDMPRFTNNAIMQISLYCSSPFWSDVDDVVQSISSFIDLHKFPIAFSSAGMAFGRYRNDQTRTITNDGDVSVGIVIDIISHGDGITNPKIYDRNRDYFGVDVTLNRGDVLSISTVTGAKTVALNGENIIRKMTAGSKWIKLEVGVNEFSLVIDNGNLPDLYYTVKYRQLYV